MRPAEFKSIGKTIAILRRRKGLRQKDIAEKLGITDKAVSKWERGLSAPDISFLNRLAVLLDTDIENIISGNIYTNSTHWKGVLLLKYPENIHASSELAGHPLIYMCLTCFFLAGIKDIIMTGPEEELRFAKHELEEKLPETVNITFQHEAVLNPGEKFLIECSPVVLYGKDLTRIIERAMASETPVRLVNNYMKEPMVPLAIFPDGVKEQINIGSDPGTLAKLISKTKQVEIERGIISIPIESSEALETADNYMKALTDVLKDRPDDIVKILKAR